MTPAERAMLTELAGLAARCLDVPRPQVSPIIPATPEDFDSWFRVYKENDSAYESLVRERILRVEVGLAHLAVSRFSENAITSVLGALAALLAEPLPYEAQS